MYEKFYGFKEKPFSVTPDTHFFYCSEKHDEALNSLVYAVEDRKGFAVITGEIGSGKTTVWHKLLTYLDGTTKVATITNSHLTPKQMLISILEEFGIEHEDTSSKVKLLNKLYQYLLEQITAGFNVVLIIDEAQNLTFSVLEEVRMISNLETEKEKLIQIILMGQPSLKEKLALPKLEQLRQRIAVYYHLNHLTRSETSGYIRHRLQVAGGNGTIIFDSPTLEAIYTHSNGVPRRINTLCDRALLTAFTLEQKSVSPDIINEASIELNVLHDSPRHCEERAAPRHCEERSDEAISKHGGN
ncbi:ExeA family protein [Candidatus Omnitrophota bacterium]